MERRMIFLLVSYAVFLGILSSLYSSYASDEAFYMNAARGIVEGLGYDGGTIAPMMSFLIAVGFYMTGNLELAARIINPAAVIATSIAIYYLSRDVLGKYSKWAVVIFMTLPMVPILAIRILPDALMNMFIVFTILFFYRAIKHNPRNFIYAGVFLAAAFMTRYSAILIVPIILSYFLVFRDKLAFFRKKELYLGILSFLAIFGIISFLAFGWNFIYLDAFSSYDYITLNEPYHFYLSMFPLVPFAAVPFLILGVANIGRRNLGILWLSISAAFLVLYKLFFLMIREFRYLIDSSMFTVLISAAGFLYLAKKFRKHKNIITTILLAVLVINISASLYLVDEFANNSRYMDLREASIWADSNCGSDIITNAGRHTDFYTGLRLIQLTPDTLGTSSGKCILYSEMEPATRVSRDDFRNLRTLREFGTVTIYSSR